MEGDLQKLIDDPRFREWHRESLQREFNTFDVLRYADYEIRHSNVLAWLLQPAETHGIDGRFLQWFVEHVNERLVAANRDPLPTVNLEAANVRVERELDYVDVTVFFKKEQCLVAIENKTGPTSSDHLGQVTGYHKKLRDKYKDRTVKSVLLTTSPDSRLNFPDIVHVGWKSVHEAIGSLQESGEFCSDSVEAFVRQYLDLVERWFRLTEGGSFKALLDDHRSVLKKMRQLLEKDGADSVGGKVPEDQAEYRDALVRLVQESRQDPKQLRKAMAAYLKSRGCETWSTHNATHGTYWLNWTDRELEESSRLLSGESNVLNWGMTFTHRNVSVGFYLYRPGKKQEKPSPLDRLIRFMEDTPIDRLEPDKYQISNNGYGWHGVYYQPLLSKDEFADMSASEGPDEVIRRLEHFMGSNESDYRRIDDYFRCLAFRPDISASTWKESP